jgi:hypothetical protein
VPFSRDAKRLVVLSKPATPQILVECDALAEKCVGLLAHEPAVFEQGIGVAIIGDLDVRDSEVVGRGVPLNSTIEVERNPLPLTVKVNAVPPAITLAGVMELTLGAGLSVGIDEPPPQPAAANVVPPITTQIATLLVQLMFLGLPRYRWAFLDLLRFRSPTGLSSGASSLSSEASTHTSVAYFHFLVSCVFHYPRAWSCSRNSRPLGSGQRTRPRIVTGKVFPVERSLRDYTLVSLNVKSV